MPVCKYFVNIEASAVAMVKGSADTGETAPADNGTRLRITVRVPSADSGVFTLLIGLAVTAQGNGGGRT